MAQALRRWDQAIREGQLTHDGDPDLVAHVANACRKDLHHRTDEGEPLWVIRKERPDSPNKIDADMAACLAWEARMDALTAGALGKRRKRSRQLVTF
jgi:phage terminase large subunit-like protein